MEYQTRILWVWVSSFSRILPTQDLTLLLWQADGILPTELTGNKMDSGLIVSGDANLSLDSWSKTLLMMFDVAGLGSLITFS